jgi:hypothetical protein
MSSEENPWQALKPPVTDNITYLTFIETNLTLDALPELHNVLQDQELNQAIGWDLVHLLLPLLPASELCLLDVAKLGNPREVVLKVSESLRILELDGLDGQSDSEAPEQENRAIAESSTSAAAATGLKSASPSDEADLPLPILQFRVLLSMLSILHPRIKTKYPSRFLSSTLQALLSTYAEASTHHEEMTEDVIKFIKALTGTKRPVLPPRRTSSKVLLQDLSNAAPDPEATTDAVPDEEMAMQRKLLQSFLTHVLEDYMLGLTSADDIPGMAWSARYQEKADPGHVVPHKQTFAEKIKSSVDFQSRLASIGAIVALAQDLGLESQTLFDVAIDVKPELRGNERAEDDPPSSPDEIPLSKTGSLLLLAARKAAETFYNRAENTPPISIFPQHETIVKNFLGSGTRGSMGLEPEALVDSILFLGLQALNAYAIGEPQSDEDFNEYLQNISLLSANSSSPTLRYQAHYLCTTVLRSHPHDLVRLSFIRDTLEHCPFENLKTSAVSWIKGETLEANPPPGIQVAQEDDEAPSIFATPVALATLSPFLFPDLTERLTAPSLQESYTQFLLDLSFYLATLNFYYLLLKAKHLHAAVDVIGLSRNGDIGGSYLGPLKEAANRYKEGLKSGGELAQEPEDTRAIMEIGILQDAISKVEAEVVALATES